MVRGTTGRIAAKRVAAFWLASPVEGPNKAGGTWGGRGRVVCDGGETSGPFLTPETNDFDPQSGGPVKTVRPEGEEAGKSFPRWYCTPESEFGGEIYTPHTAGAHAWPPTHAPPVRGAACSLTGGHVHTSLPLRKPKSSHPVGSGPAPGGGRQTVSKSVPQNDRDGFRPTSRTNSAEGTFPAAGADPCRNSLFVFLRRNDSLTQFHT